MCKNSHKFTQNIDPKYEYAVRLEITKQGVTYEDSLEYNNFSTHPLKTQHPVQVSKVE